MVVMVTVAMAAGEIRLDITPPVPYGDSGDSEVVCGPYGCYWNEATAYLPKIVMAEQAW